jgi:hypothetical protein
MTTGSSLMYVSGRLQGFLERRRQWISPAGHRPGESMAPFLLVVCLGSGSTVWSPAAGYEVEKERCLASRNE